MTRWNASISTFTILHLLLTLSQPISAAAFRFHARHDGKSHKNHINRDIDARQNIPNAPFAGIGIISDAGATLPSATTAITASPPPPEQFETISAIDTAGFGGAGAPSMASMSAATASNSQSTIDPLASPVFPITVIQVPIYTICPDAPGNTNLTSAISPNATAQYSSAVAGGNATQRTSATPIPFNATTLLSNISFPAIPSSTLPTTTPTPNQAAVPNARIILNPNGCQTLYSGSTTQICSTIITRGGQLPITVSDCSQWVTFSSSTLTSAIPSPTATAGCNCPNTPVATQLLGVNGSGDENDNAVSSNSTLLPIPTSPNAPNGNNNGIAFFVAPWHVIAAGAIPDVVQVVSGNNNNTSSEKWSVSTSTKIVTGVKTVRFEGPAIAILPPLPSALPTDININTLPLSPPLSPQYPTSSITTSITLISYTTTQTTTSTILIPTIVRAAILTTPSAAIVPENIITVQMTIPQTRTWVLEEVAANSAAASVAGGDRDGGMTPQGQGQGQGQWEVVTEMEMVTITVPGEGNIYTSTID